LITSYQIAKGDGMKITSISILEKINFSDFQVLKTKLDKKLKSITFATNEASRLVNGKRIELGEGYLEIVNYNSIHITSYNAQEDIEKSLTEDQYEQLDEICEIEVYETKLIVKGFTKQTANWIEFDIIGGHVKGEFLDKT
jgi:hypothetical protein